jgi:uncharacterized protein (DUF2252 family)
LDLVRCATSILLAADEWGMSPVNATGMVLTYLDSYHATLLESAKTGEVGEIAPKSGEGPLWDLLGEAALASRDELLAHYTKRTRDGKRKILSRQGRQPQLGRARQKKIREAVEQHGRDVGKPDAFRVLDVRSQIAGLGSLGLRRYTVLIEGGGSPNKNRLLAIKEARPSSLIRLADGQQLETGGNDAQRIVEAQKRLQARVGLGLCVVEIDGVSYRMREMVPDENRANLDRFRKKPAKLRSAVEVAGRITAWSQVRGSRGIGEDRTQELAHWASGSALQAVLAGAVRYADQVQQDYGEFHRSHAAKLRRSAWNVNGKDSDAHDV